MNGSARGGETLAAEVRAFPFVRLDEIAQMCDAPSDAYSAGEWCEATQDAVGMAWLLRNFIELIREDHPMPESRKDDCRVCGLLYKLGITDETPWGDEQWNG